jgi:beta-lactamase regulating signal transducer with metallopeptidase domain
MSFQQNIYDVLQSTGLAIINSFWQSGCIVLVYLLLTLFIEIKASVRYFILVCLQIISFFLFIYTFLSDLFIYKPVTGFFFSNELINQIQNTALMHSFFLIVREFSFPLLPYFAEIYFLILVFQILKFFYQYLNIQNFYGDNKIIETVNWNQFINKACHRFKIKQKILLHWSDKIPGPLTIGFLKPIILIPLANFNYLSQEQMEAVLLHELAHIKRFDYLINLCMKLIESFLFFNPFSHYINSMISTERENSCDDLVLENHYNPIIYADALLQLAFLSTGHQSSYLMHAAKKENVLLTRINRIVGLKKKPALTTFSFIGILSPLLLITISLIIHAATPFAEKKSKSNSFKDTHKILYYSSASIKLPTKIVKNIFVHSHKKINSALQAHQNLTTSKLAIQDSALVSDIALNEIVEALKEFKNIQTQKINISNENKGEKFVSVNLSNSDDELKQRLKSYIAKKNSSILEIKNTLDSINSAETKYLVNYSSKERNHLLASVNSMFIPALYFEKKKELQKTDSIIHPNPDHFTLTDTDRHIYIIINLKNVNGSNDQLIIDLTSKEIE